MSRKSCSDLMSAKQRRPFSPWAVAVCLAALVLSSVDAQACGANLHFYIGDVALQKLPAGKLKDHITKNRATREAYMMGLLFPDIMFGVADTDDSNAGRNEGEASRFLHSPDFLTSYAKAIRAEMDEGKASSKHIAHFMGVIGHIVADANFDNVFVTRIGNQCFGGSMDDAQKFTDQLLDRAVFDTVPESAFDLDFRKAKAPLVDLGNKRADRVEDRRENREENRKQRALEEAQEELWASVRPERFLLKKEENRYVPGGFLEPILKKPFELDGLVFDRDIPKVLERGVDRQWRLHVEGLVIGRSVGKGPPNTVVAEKCLKEAQEKCEWGTVYKNWFREPGGVVDTAVLLAGFQEQVWAVIDSGESPEIIGRHTKHHDREWGWEKEGTWRFRNFCITNPVDADGEYCLYDYPIEPPVPSDQVSVDDDATAALMCGYELSLK